MKYFPFGSKSHFPSILKRRLPDSEHLLWTRVCQVVFCPVRPSCGCSSCDHPLPSPPVAPLSYRIKRVSASKALRTVPDKWPAFSKCYPFLLPPPCPPLHSSLSGMSSFPELHPISPLLFCSSSDTERRENGKRINYKSIKPEPPQAQTVPLNKLEKIIPSKRMKSRDRVPGLVGRVQAGFQPPTSALFTPSAWHSCAVNSLHKWTW